MGAPSREFHEIRESREGHLCESRETHLSASRGDVRTIVAGDPTQVKCGLETWFTVPGVPAPLAAPPRWKMALVTWLAVLPQAFALAYLIPRTLAFLASIALSTAIPVALLTWVVMPWLSRRLYGWLYEASVPLGRSSHVATPAFEAVLVDLERSDPRLQRRGRHTEPGGGAKLA